MSPVQEWITRQTKYQRINNIRVYPSYCYTYLALSWAGTERAETQKRVTIIMFWILSSHSLYHIIISSFCPWWIRSGYVTGFFAATRFAMRWKNRRLRLRFCCLVGRSCRMNATPANHRTLLPLPSPARLGSRAPTHHLVRYPTRCRIEITLILSLFSKYSWPQPTFVAHNFESSKLPKMSSQCTLVKNFKFYLSLLESTEQAQDACCVWYNCSEIWPVKSRLQQTLKVF